MQIYLIGQKELKKGERKNERKKLERKKKRKKTLERKKENIQRERKKRCFAFSGDSLQVSVKEKNAMSKRFNYKKYNRIQLQKLRLKVNRKLLRTI